MLDRPATHGLMGQLHGGERRVEPGRDLVLVVEPDDGDIVWDGQAGTADGAVGAHGHAVGVALDGGGWLGQLEQPGRGDSATEGVVHVDGHELGIEVDTVFPEGSAVAGEALCVSRVGVGLVQVADAPMAVLDEMAGGGVATELLVRHHPGVARGRRCGSRG